MSRMFVVATALVAGCSSSSSSPPAGDGPLYGSVTDAAAEPEQPIAGIAAVWPIHDGEKIERDDLAHPAKAGNTAWRDGVVHVFGGRNEVVAFQVIVEADDIGVHGLDAKLTGLSRRGGGGQIVYTPPGDDPSNSVERPIQVFTENYMHVTEPTHASWIYPASGPAVPADPVGWKPVQLVPENARLGGLPIDVAPRTNQALWIEVYIPRGLPPGMYDGAVALRSGGGLHRVPVELEVFDFELPDENSLTAMIYFEPEQVSLYQGHDVVDRYHRFAHRHRIELTNAYTAASIDAARGRLDGSDFTPAHGYDGPGASVGNTVVPASFYGPGSAYDARASAWSTSDAWMTNLAAKVPGARTFLYMPDEPSSSEYSKITTIAGNIHSNPGPGKALPIFVTSTYKAALDGAIDIWASAAESFDPARAQTERAKGKQYIFYNGTRPQTGVLTIDSPATDPRVNAWAAYKGGVDLYFYWHADHWRHNFQKQGERNQDVWGNSITFDNRGQPGKSQNGQGFIHGDGVVVYPGEDVLHPEQNRGIAGPIGTIQLANLRRGLQDHLYLTLAHERGLDTEVTAALAAVVPGVFGSSIGFAQTGDAFEQARYQLARALTK